MAARATRSASGDSGNQADESSLAEPHDLRDAERTLTKLLDLTRRGVLPADFVPALSNLKTALAEAPCTRCHLLALSHDELGVIFDGLADPLEPELAVIFSSTCKGLRTPLLAALELLQEQRAGAVALCSRLGDCHFDKASGSFLAMTCLRLRDANEIVCEEVYHHLDARGADFTATLGMILRTNGLPELQSLQLNDNAFGDAGIRSLVEGLGPGSLPSLVSLDLDRNNLGPAGVEALAAAIRRGAMPNLAHLDLQNNGLGFQGSALLSPVIRKLPLERLVLTNCKIGCEGVNSLLGDLGKDDFKKLEVLYLRGNKITNKGCATISEAICRGLLPVLRKVEVVHEVGDQPLDQRDSDSDPAARQAIYDAIQVRHKS